MILFTAQIEGVVPSKKNAWKIGGSRGVYIDKGLKSSLDAILWQLMDARNEQGVNEPLEGDLRVEAVFHVETLRTDLDNIYTTLQDLLQKAEIIQNDRLISSFTVHRKVNKTNPRVEVKIYSA